MPERGRKSVARGNLAAPKAQRPGPSAEHMELGEGVESRRIGCVKATTTPPPNPNLSAKPITEMPEQPIVTATRKTVRCEKLEPKHSAAPKPDTGKARKKAATGVKAAAAKPTPPSLVVPTQPSTSPLEGICDLDHHPLQARVELTRRLLTSIFLATGAACPQTFLKTVAEYGSTP